MGGGIRTSNAAIVTMSKYVLTLPNKRKHSHHCCEPAHTLTFKVFVYSNDAQWRFLDWILVILREMKLTRRKLLSKQRPLKSGLKIWYVGQSFLFDAVI